MPAVRDLTTEGVSIRPRRSRSLVFLERLLGACADQTGIAVELVPDELRHLGAGAVVDTSEESLGTLLPTMRPAFVFAAVRRRKLTPDSAIRYSTGFLMARRARVTPA